MVYKLKKIFKKVILIKIEIFAVVSISIISIANNTISEKISTQNSLEILETPNNFYASNRHNRIITRPDSIFGLKELIDNELKDVYENPSNATAIKHMVWIEVPVWKLKDGKKVSDTEKVQVLNAVKAFTKRGWTWGKVFRRPD